MDSLRTVLFRALTKSHLPMLRSALRLGASPAYEAGDPMPVFHAALIGGDADIEILQALEGAGADPSTADHYEMATPLHLAIALPDSTALDWFIAQGLDVNFQTRRGETPLMRAATRPDEDDSDALSQRRLRDARILVAAGADPVLADASGRTALHYATEGNAAEIVALLLLAGAEINRADGNGDTALHLAAQKGYDGIVRQLLQGGADARATNALGFSALHVLAEQEGVAMTPAHLRVADTLIKAGGDVAQADNRGFTPLVAAAATGNIPIAAVLVAHHADVNANASAALCHAVTFEDHDMTDLLLKAGAEVNTVCGEGEERPLHTAAHEGFLHGVRALLNHGAEIEARNVDGETALLIAARRRKYPVVAHLIERGANTGAEDRYGQTAAILASQRQDTALARLLNEAPALRESFSPGDREGQPELSPLGTSARPA